VVGERKLLQFLIGYRFTPRFSVQLPSNSRRWLRRTFACKRHQMRHLCDL